MRTGHSPRILALQVQNYSRMLKQVIEPAKHLAKSKQWMKSQLDYSWIAHELQVGPRWDDVITWSDFKIETFFGFLNRNYTGQFTFLLL